MADTTLVMISYCAIVLAATAYFASNVGAEQRGYRRHKGWLAVMGAFLGIAVAAAVLGVAG